MHVMAGTKPAQPRCETVALTIKSLLVFLIFCFLIIILIIIHKLNIVHNVRVYDQICRSRYIQINVIQIILAKAHLKLTFCYFKLLVFTFIIVIFYFCCY